MTVLFSDSFTRAADATSLGTSDSYSGGTAKAWSILGTAVYGVDASGYAYCSTKASSGHGAAYVDTGNADGSITCAIKNTTTSDFPKVAFRIVDAENFLFVEHDINANQLVLRKYVSGSGTTIASKTSAGLTATSDVIKITANGSAITVFLNGTQVITATDTTNSTSTKWGFNAYNYTGARFDNIIVEDLTTGGTGTIYTGSGMLQGTSTLSQPEKLIYKASGTLQGTSNVSSVENSILKALGTLQGSSSLTSSETYTTQTGTTYTGGGTLQGSSNVSGNEHYLYKASGTLQGISSLSSGETLILFTGIYSASGIVQGFSILSATEQMVQTASGTAQGYSSVTLHEPVQLIIGTIHFTGHSPTTINLRGNTNSIHLRGNTNSTIHLKGGIQ